MNNPLQDKKIILGISGSIAAYKAAELASSLTKAGALVDVILTPSAEKMVSPLTFVGVTGRKAYTERDLWGTDDHVVHITLGRRADLMVVAPATANIIAKLAHGIGDNLLSVTALAIQCPLVIAPAMDAGMFTHPATQDNIHILKQRNATILGPAKGHLASGLQGKGRMLEAKEIFASLRYLLSRENPLKGKRIVVTAGGTQEPIDPVRFLSNHSSGKQGYAVAQSALNAGADVTLISTPTKLDAPVGAEFIAVQTAEEMRTAVVSNAKEAHAVIMAAAVADFRPAAVEIQKIKKDKDFQNLELEATTDILKELGAYKQKEKSDLILIGFAAESEELIENASKKLAEKNLDFIVANDISREDAGFAVDTNEVIILFKDGSQKKISLRGKDLIADEIIDNLINLVQS
jgi:phosphopantothenoylcysteine decarboxylase/phosphopantothenate--cysteine ligase